MGTVTQILLILLYLVIESVVGYFVVRSIVGKPQTDHDRKKFARGLTAWVVLGIIGVIFFKM